jgi:hypothetical protein
MLVRSSPMRMAAQGECKWLRARTCRDAHRRKSAGSVNVCQPRVVVRSGQWCGRAAAPRSRLACLLFFGLVEG